MGALTLTHLAKASVHYRACSRLIELPSRLLVWRALTSIWVVGERRHRAQSTARSTPPEPVSTNSRVRVLRHDGRRSGIDGVSLSGLDQRC